MAFSVTFSISSTPSFAPSCKTYRPFLCLKPISVKASSTSIDYSTVSVAEQSTIPLKSNNWEWKYKDNSINIYYEEHAKESSDPPKNILMIPTISDVSTVEEWRLVARDIVQRVGKINWQATIVDWPGLGYSDRPKMDYDADIMEKFLVDFMNASDSPLRHSSGTTKGGCYLYAKLAL